ncbi:MAG: hypothetical protein ACXAC2_01120 [Candidatus Kariarchaeaceae archaeon]
MADQIPITEFFNYESPIEHQILLSIFYNQRRIIGRTRLQKLVFIASRKIFSTDSFEYSAYRFGPYSVKLLAAMDELLELEYVREQIIEFQETAGHVYEFELTDDGLLYAEELINDIPLEKLGAVEEMIHQHGYKELDSLLRTVYSDFPEYADNSVIKERLLISG